MSSPSSSSLPRPPTLPTELIDQILSDPSLSKLDLAKCARIARQLLPFARQHLYKAVTLQIDQFGSFNTPDRVVWVYSDSCDSLVSTLERSAELRQLVSKVEIELCQLNKKKLDINNITQSPELATRHLLSLMPQVKSLTFPEDWDLHLSVQHVIYDEGSRLEELDVGGDIVLGELQDWSNLPNLRKLKCDSLWPREGSGRVDIPPQLEILELRIEPNDSRPSPTTDARLRVLCCDVSHDLLWFVSRSPTLQHLIFIQNLPIVPRLDPSTLSQFSQLPDLRSFSWTSIYRHSAHLIIFLNHLPPSVKRLDFPRQIPFDQLETFFASRASSNIRILGLSSIDAGIDWNKETMETLKKVCEAKEIEIEYIGEVQGVFQM